jgi:hypothetical protein
MVKMKKEIQTIGLVGSVGFGVAAIKSKYLKDGWSKLDGHNDPQSANYGNVLDNNGSVMVWIPKFYFRWTKDNECLISDIPKDGFVLHRAFIDGGAEQRGFFIDKYECGNDNGVFTSKDNLEPCATYGSNSISKLNNNPSSNLGGLTLAAKTRGNDYSIATIFMWNALGMLSYANNGNLLKRIDYHNNQECGVKNVDLHRYETASGFTKLNDEDSIFKVLKQSAAIKDITNEDEAFDEKFYEDLDLSGVVDGNDGWTWLSDETKTFKMSTDINSDGYIKTCMGIPRKKALSDDYNDRYARAGIYRYLENDFVPLVGGTWGYTAYAGVFCLNLSGVRSRSDSYVGGRASVFLS